MQELEKILEEIREMGDIQFASYTKPLIAVEDVEKIIRKHMSGKDTDIPANDGWIPVERGLPEKDGFYIATIDGEIIGEEDPFVGLAEFDRGDWYDDEDYTRVIAWRPLPEPYRPERSEGE